MANIFDDEKRYEGIMKYKKEIKDVRRVSNESTDAVFQVINYKSHNFCLDKKETSCGKNIHCNPKQFVIFLFIHHQ